jgi:hypothetical protein
VQQDADAGCAAGGEDGRHALNSRAARAGPSRLRGREGLDEAPPVQIEITAAEFRHDRARREWLMIGLALSVLVTIMAIVVAGFAIVDQGEPAAA